MKEWLAYQIRKKASRDECLKTPVYERRFVLNLFKELDEQREEQQEEQSSTSGKGKRVTKLSGDALKQKLKNNEINPNNVG